MPRVCPAGGTDSSFELLYDDRCVLSDDGLKKKYYSNSKLYGA